ncbi:hypothetical protein F8568_014540 [Actinomadura sp. LD22]|uniref:SnoaL-like domain-containing protein n=1 Tax=Actinomadura physcomitrii TaxID=2650748 RepID=A0A6I4MCS0_9ACTN|nr:nuclear transport factor 2 family protein [Actinomadura physcomitrii]MWA01571.1 hypothetical protein [Actinomadura physcomitrii]
MAEEPMHSLARRFVDAWNSRDTAGLDALFHPDFRWHIAVTDHGDPEMRPLNSRLLHGMNLPWGKAIYNKKETIDIFSGIFAASEQFSLDLRTVIASGDRAALELVGDAVNPANGRRYDNLYCYVLHERDGQLVLLREYQDTLLLFDVWVAQ